VSFAKQLSRTQGESFEPRFIFELIGAQWLLMTPIIGAFALYSFVKNLRTLSPTRSSPTILLVATSLPFALYLLLHSLHDRVNANWPAPLMPAFAVLTAIALEKIKSRFLKRSAFAIGYALIGLIFLEIIHPFLPIPPDRNPAMLTRGWVELGKELETIAKEKGLSWIATASYEHTGGLGFALQGKMNVIQINERIRYGFMPPPDPALVAKPALFIMWDYAAEDTLKNLAACIGHAEKIGTISRKFNDTIIENFSIYQLNDVKITPPIYDRKRDPSSCQL
jgi:predicted outer membrane lipoprotein